MAPALLLLAQASGSLLPAASDSRLKRTRTAALRSPGYCPQLTKFNSTPPGYVVDWAPNSGAYWRSSEGIIPASPRELVVSPNSCRDASYTGLPNGRISGVAASPPGKLPEPILIRIWPANRVDAIENYWWGRNETGRTGAFQIGPLLPGS